jgi:hypothetical protein
MPIGLFVEYPCEREVIEKLRMLLKVSIDTY